MIEYKGKPVSSVQTSFESLCKKSGVKTFPHMLRHTFASQLIMSGASTIDVARLLGHADTATTERIYVKLSSEHLRKTANLLPLGMQG